MAPVRTTGAIVVAAISISMAVLSYIVSSKKKKNKKFRNGLIDAIGNTPLIRINSLSDATGCEVNIKQLTFSIFV
jgi:cysteine synthase A